MATLYDRSGELDWVGAGVEHLGQVYSHEWTYAETSYNTWTPSTTAKTIISSSSLSNKPVIDLATYEYALRWKFETEPVYDGSEVTTALVVRCVMQIWQLIFKRANSFANIAAKNHAGNACTTLTTAALLDYWNNNSAHTYTWSASYGIYMGATAATFSNSSTNTPTLTIKTPSVSARCSTTYFSTTNAEHVDKSNSKIKVTGDLYRYKPRGILMNQYDEICDLYDNGI